MSGKIINLQSQTAIEAMAPSKENIDQFLTWMWNKTPEDIQLQYLAELSAHEKYQKKLKKLPTKEQFNRMNPARQQDILKKARRYAEQLSDKKVQLYNKYIQPLEAEIMQQNAKEVQEQQKKE